MSDELPKSIACETLNVMGVDLVFHVLDNGQRIIEAESAREFFKMLAADMPGVDVEAAMKNVTPEKFRTDQ